MLSPEERRLLFQYCSHHPVAYCRTCQVLYGITQLAVDDLGQVLCLTCDTELSHCARTHIASCTFIRVQAEDARERTRGTQRMSQELRKQSQQAQDRAEVLRAEAESLMAKAARLVRRRAGEAA
jgi:hypothetical protein